MYEYQRRLINEAAKFGPLSPKEKANLPKAYLNEEIVNLGEGFSAMGGAQKATVDAGLSVSTYRSLLSRLQKFPGHALVLDITTPTGPGAARGGLTGAGSEIKVVKIADIGKYELMGYKFPSLKPGAKAQRTWPDHKGEAIILAINESVNEEVENLDEESEFKQNAKRNFDVSTKLAKKKDKDHDSQWGVGFRAYCRAVISGNAVNMDPPKEPGLKSGWNDARQMIAMGRRLKEEVENLEEAQHRAYHPPVYDYLKLPTNVQAMSMHKNFADRMGKYNRFWNTFFAADAHKKSPDKAGQAADHLMRAVDYGVGMEKAPIIAAKFGLAKAQTKKEEVENLEEMTGKEAAKILSGVRKVKVVKPTSISSQMKVGSTYQLTSAGAHINPSLPGGDKKYRLVTGSSDMGTRSQTGAIISTNLAKAIKRGEIEIVKEEVEDLGEAKAVPITRGSSTGMKPFTIGGRKVRVDADQFDKNKYHVYAIVGGRALHKGTITQATEPNMSQVIDTLNSGDASAYAKLKGLATKTNEEVENIDEASIGELISKMTEGEAEYILMGGKPSKFKGETPTNLKIAANKVMARYDLKMRQMAVAAHNRTKKEEVENLGEATTGFPDLDKWFSKLPPSFVAEVKTLSKILHAPGTSQKTPVNNNDRLTIEKLMVKHKVKTYVSINMMGKPWGEQWSYSARMVIRHFKKYFDLSESVQEPVSEGVMKDEIMKFLFAMPKQASDEIAQLSKKMGGLKPNTTTETAVKAILVKHKVKLLRDMEWSLKAVIHFFDDMMEEQVSEAYAPQWAHNQQKKFPIMGEFKHKGENALIQYRKIGDGPGSDWAKSHGMTHEIFLRPVWNDHRDTRFAIIKGTVAIVATDEGPDGKPVLEKWPITSHRRFPDHPSNPTGYRK